MQCLQCGTIQKKTLYMLETTPVCFKCFPKSSKSQLEILEFVRSLGFEAIDSDRNVIFPKEIDVYVPSRRFGIEYNGLYWHSEKFLSPNGHQVKHDLASTANINLFSVYEDEWRDKRSIVEAMIKHRLGIFDEKINARSCSIVKLDNHQRRSFFDANHLEGDTAAMFAIGLEHEGKIVAATSFRRPFHRAYSNYVELGRSSVKSGCNVRGWLSKLISSQLLKNQIYTREKKGIVSYVDSRVGAGKAYEFAGFSLLKQSTGLRFWWTDYVNRYNRFKVKADLTNGITQKQAALNVGVVKIYGCSNSLWLRTF